MTLQATIIDIFKTVGDIKTRPIHPSGWVDDQLPARLDPGATARAIRGHINRKCNDATHPYGVVLRFDELEERFAALAKRAQRIGVEPPSFRALAQRSLLTPAQGFTVTATLIEVGDSPPVKFDGWTFVATVEHDASTGINVVRRAPSAEGLDLPEATWVASNTCDHCGTNRRRNETFVVRHDDGQLIRVGRSCLKDFTGHPNPSHLVTLVELERLVRSLRDDEGYDTAPAPRPSVDEFLAYAAHSIRRYGWVSRGAARDTSLTATADDAERQLWAVHKEERACRSVPVEDKPSTNDRERATAALEWVRSWDIETIESDYRRNLYAVAIKESFNQKSTGLLASAVSTHTRHLEQELERRELAGRVANSEYLGDVGDKLGRKLSKKDRDNGATARPAWTAHVVGIREFASDWGGTTLVSLRDSEGNSATWWSSRDPEFPDGDGVAVGDIVVVAGTIKKTELYTPRRGDAPAYKQTTLTRVNLQRPAAA